MQLIENFINNHHGNLEKTESFKKEKRAYDALLERLSNVHDSSYDNNLSVFTQQRKVIEYLVVKNSLLIWLFIVLYLSLRII